jgi:magnesium-transporting ATPase (P-type)
VLDRSTDASARRRRIVPLDKAAVHHAVEQMAARGLRVLAFVRRHIDAQHARSNTPTLPRTDIPRPARDD